MTLPKKTGMLEWFYEYDGDYGGGFDVREVLEFMGEPDKNRMGFRVYIKNGKSHWLTEQQLIDLLTMMSEKRA